MINAALPTSSMEWLDRLYRLCEENGILLVLFKAPTNSWRYWWYDEWDAEISAYAARRSLPYCNAIPAADSIGLDWSADTYDGGVHLNVSGAEKLSVRFGRYLRADSALSDALPDRRTDSAFSSVGVRAWSGSKQESAGNGSKKAKSGKLSRKKLPALSSIFP